MTQITQMGNMSIDNFGSIPPEIRPLVGI
jgi:hypothetical protein